MHKICNELEANVNTTVARLRAETDRKIGTLSMSSIENSPPGGGEGLRHHCIDGVTTKTLSEGAMYSNHAPPQILSR